MKRPAAPGGIRGLTGLLLAAGLLGLWPVLETILFGNGGPMVWLLEHLPGRLLDRDPYLGVHLAAFGLASLLLAAGVVWLYPGHFGPRALNLARGTVALLLVPSALALLFGLLLAAR